MTNPAGLAEHGGLGAIGGDSAGGALAIAAMVALRERGVALPSAAILLSPWLDVYPALAPELPEATEALDAVSGFLRRHAVRGAAVGGA